MESAPSSPGARRRSPAELMRRASVALNARWQLRSASALGPRVTLHGRLALSNAGRLVLGDRVRLVSTPFPLELVTLPGGEIRIGTNVFINFGTSIVASSRV